MSAPAQRTAPDETLVADQLVVTVRYISSLREQDVNARIMQPDTFNRLTENIRKSGKLESLPYCVQPGGEGPIRIVSGHHRVKAAKAAGLSRVPILLDRARYTEAQITAKQLAHNALVGEDVEEVLRQLVESITSDADALLESGLADLVTTPTEDVPVLHVPSLVFEWKTITIAFLPAQFENWQELLKDVRGADLVCLAREDQREPFDDAIAQYSLTQEVRSSVVLIALLTEMALDYVRAHPVPESD